MLVTRIQAVLTHIWSFLKHALTHMHTHTNTHTQTRARSHRGNACGFTHLHTLFYKRVHMVLHNHLKNTCAWAKITSPRNATSRHCFLWRFCRQPGQATFYMYYFPRLGHLPGPGKLAFAVCCSLQKASRVSISAPSGSFFTQMPQAKVSRRSCTCFFKAGQMLEQPGYGKHPNYEAIQQFQR
jgi:hypothetical protein